MLFDTPSLGPAEEDVLQQIADLKEKLRWQLHEPRRWSGSVRKLSFARAIQGSNGIEGYDAALDDAAAVALGEEPMDASEETRLALEGYRDAITYVIQSADDSEFEYSTQLLKSMHFMMLSYSLKHRPGRWRTGSIFVQEEATAEIVYEAPDVDDVPGLIRELVSTLQTPAGPQPPLVAAAMAHLNLVMIQPFRDGNGRMARCLQSLVIARSATLSPVFMSIEEYLGRNTQAYYDVLASVGQGTWNPDADARPWLRFALTAHLRQARTMLRRVRESNRMWSELESLVSRAELPERTLVALFDAATGLRVRNVTYRANLKESGGEITEQTAGRDLKALVDKELLVAVGEKRVRTYVAAPSTRAVRERIVGSRDRRDDSDPFQH